MAYWPQTPVSERVPPPPLFETFGPQKGTAPTTTSPNLTCRFHVITLDVGHVRVQGVVQVTVDDFPAVVVARAQKRQRRTAGQRQRFGHKKAHDCREMGGKQTQKKNVRRRNRTQISVLSCVNPRRAKVHPKCFAILKPAPSSPRFDTWSPPGVHFAHSLQPSHFFF